MTDNYDIDEDEAFNIGPSPMSSSHQIEEKFIFEGYLKKKSPKGLLKVWQERWFRLTTNGIYYYKKKDSKDAQAHIPMYAISSISCDQSTFKKKGFRFDITLANQFSGRVFSVTARTEQECLEWVTKLRNALAAYEDHVAHFRKATNVVTEDNPKNVKFWKINPNDTMKTATNLVTQQSLPEQDVFENVLFSDYKIIADQSTTDFGSIFLIGGNDYPVTHHSFLLHSISKDHLHYMIGKDTMKSLGELSEYPLFARQICIGETSDAIYAMYHPPFRMQSDSIFAWLDYLKSFPEDIVCHLGSQILLVLEYLHSQNIVFVNLCPESLFFDMDGNLRILDTALTLPPSIVPVMSVEYTCPENISLVGSEGNTACDFWRLGILLYELVMGSLPFTSYAGMEEIDDNEHRQFVLEQISNLDITSIDFPPQVSQNFIDLISKLLVLDPSKRLTSFEAIKAHPFFENVSSWDINDILQKEKPQWILESVVEPMLHDPQTPINLTPEPEDITKYRISVTIKQVRALPTECMSRLYCSIHVEGDIQKTKVINQTSEPLISEFNERFRFDLLTGATLPDSSDIVIELISKKLEAEGQPLVGSISFPINELHIHQAISDTFTILGPDGSPIGELDMSLKITPEIQPLATHISLLADNKKSFTELFLKPVPQYPAKLWSMIVHESVIATAQSETENIQLTTAMNTTKTNLSTTQRKNPFVDANPTQPEDYEPMSPSFGGRNSSTTLSGRISQMQLSEPSVTRDSSVSPMFTPSVPETKVEQPKLDPDLNPANWRTATDDQSGDIYYYNKVTKKTSWTPPACLEER